MVQDLKSRRIVVTGGGGFLGRHLVRKLRGRGYKNIFPVTRLDCDLKCEKMVRAMYNSLRPDIVLHLAAVAGGIGFNRKNPAHVFYDNVMINTQVLHQAYCKGVNKFIGISSVCAYPAFVSVPFCESDIWNGYPEETNAPYGLSKRMMLAQSLFYRQQYDFNSVVLLLANFYGPGDNFDPESSHVIPALIKKFIDAKLNKEISVEVWGTGRPTRDFLYVEDAVKGIILAMENYDEGDPINIGTGLETSIENLVFLIKEIVGFKGEIIWQARKPDGQKRRVLNVDKASRKFNFEAWEDIEEGLKKTIDWYISTENEKIA